MNPDIVAVAAEWAIAHPVGYATVAILSLAAIHLVAALLVKEEIVERKEPIELKYDPPRKIDWVHAGQVLRDPTYDGWEVTFVGPDFVTVAKTKNVSYAELQEWSVIL